MMDVQTITTSQTNAYPTGSNADNPTLDLVGGPFAVIESDPGVFTSLARKFGIKGVELVEVYDIEPWAMDHLDPYGLIFCFLWHKDSHPPADFNDPAAERVWFANQLSDDACATHAILNVVLNCPEIEIGEELESFKHETKDMSPVMRGLAITNSPILRPAHNSLARPADIRGALNALTTNTFNAQREILKEKQKKERESKPPPAKRTKTASPTKGKEKAKTEAENDVEESYHFVGYVPAFGKVWELDGLKSGPLEVGELPTSSASTTQQDTVTDAPSTSKKAWMDVVRPALRMKMEKYGGSGNDGSNIRFSLLAMVSDNYQKVSDELEFLKREKVSLEKRLQEGWKDSVDRILLDSTASVLDRGSHATELKPPFARDFASRKMARDLEIMKMPQPELIAAWETCLRDMMRAKIAVEDEIARGVAANTDHIKRTFDYEPFFKEFLTCLHNEGLLNSLLDLDGNGKKRKATGSGKKGGYLTDKG